MADNILNARIKLKYDTLSHWTDVEDTFTPLVGEVILYYIPSQDTGHGMTRPCVAMKVGDGRSTLGQLNWTQAQAGDVYSWAKKEHGVATDITSTILKNNIGNSSAGADETANVQEVLNYLTQVVGTLTGGEGADESVEGKILAALNNLTLNDTAIDGQFITEVDQSNGVISVTRRALAATDIPNLPASKITSGIDNTVTSGSNNLITSGAVATAISGLTGAMHFKGAVTPLPDATATTTFNTYESGDVVLGPNDKEYVYKKGNDAASSSWIELGDESSHVIKGSITDNDFADGATLPQSRIANLTMDLAAKQDELGFTTGTAYNKTTNPVATKDYVDDIAAAANTTYTLTWNNKTAVSDAEKLILTPSSGTAQKLDLKTVATTGNIYDLENALDTQNPPVDNGEIRTAKYFILDCGDSTHLVDTLS